MCDAHAHLEPRKRFDRERGKTSERGYGWLWQSKIRPRILRRDPFCRLGVICDPDKTGRVAPSTEVDHIIPREAGGSDADENLQGACKACHSWKTATQDSEFVKRKES